MLPTTRRERAVLRFENSTNWDRPATTWYGFPTDLIGFDDSESALALRIAGFVSEPAQSRALLGQDDQIVPAGSAPVSMCGRRAHAFDANAACTCTMGSSTSLLRCCCLGYDQSNGFRARSIAPMPVQISIGSARWSAWRPRARQRAGRHPTWGRSRSKRIPGDETSGASG